MSLSTPPTGTALGSSTYPHRQYHGALTEVRYAHPSGDNSDDGLTWGTAKADVVSAYDALPSTGGTIYIGDETYWDSVNTDRGLWLLGSGDPAYNGGSPTGGWRVRKSVNFIGMGGSFGGNQHHGGAVDVRGGSGTDRTKPSIWISGGDGPLYFENINNSFPAVAWRFGIKSNLSAYINTASITMRNCSFGLNKTPGNGPGVEIGYLFWGFFEHCGFAGNDGDGAYTLTAATRVGTTATFTTSITHFMEVGDTVWVSGVTPSGYNGTWTITSVTATTFVVTLSSDPGASGSAFGVAEPVKSYRRAAVAHEAWLWGGQSSGLLYFTDCNFNGGGFYYKPSNSTSWGNIVMRDITHEGDFSGPEPPTLLVRTETYGDHALGEAGYNIYVQNIELADADTGVTVEVEGPNSDPFIVTAINASTSGNATQLPFTTSRRQSGISNGTFIGRVEGEGRSFSPVSVRYANLASHTLSGGSWTTGRLAPDGTTNASSLTNASVEAHRSLMDPDVGDWIVAGVWRRVRTMTTSVVEDTPRFAMSHTDFIFDNEASGFNLNKPAEWNDGGWEWVCDGHKLVTAGTAANEIVLVLQAGTGNTIDYFAPILFRIPVSDGLDDDEVRELIRHLRTYPSSAVAGDVVTLAGQTLLSTGELEIDGALNHDGTTVGFYGVTPATRPTAYTQTYATADKTQANLTVGADLGAFTDPPSAAEMAALRTFVNALKADLIDVKQITNSIIDDLQTLGILQ